ncbi:hypothetical protein BXY57_2330 [Thermoflavifilum aggregans]|uniref:Phosphate-selective porin O/P n=1 Tax=Thermoflavifilum aggregans TaxID=454188 RepID=A0A2M9CY75_9BACT|nr:hypothetical protein [Thermoflavifilum aggregans]PJJ76698.1 hypothetical protein BXY57_2330 [Thermoflavifilum aggregans]
MFKLTKYEAAICGLAMAFFPIFLHAQQHGSTGFWNQGKLTGYTFGDYYYKAHSDSLNRGQANQYTGIPQNANAFQFRRIYLAYEMPLSDRFQAQLAVAAEDVTDVTQSGKYTFYIKLANLRWKNIWKGTDLIIGQQPTPAFPLLEEPTWKYRSVERTIADIRRTPSFDMGAGLQGTFDPQTKNFGYNLLVGNGTGAKPSSNRFKWFYADLWAKLFQQHLVLDLYADYDRMHWQPGFHQSRNMWKLFAAFTSPQFTVGATAFVNFLKQGMKATDPVNSVSDTLNQQASGISVFVHGQLLPGKLNYFARMDHYNPAVGKTMLSPTQWTGLVANYDPQNTERFITAGFDFTPIPQVHLMPNIWYNQYTSKNSSFKGKAYRDYDLVYRITFYYVFAK